MKTIYFVRHGETATNIANVISGSGTDVRLTGKGRAQAEKTGQELKGREIELVVCSPMLRTVETAEIIAKQIGYSADKIIKNPLFIERNWGIYEGGPQQTAFRDMAANKLDNSVETTQELHERLVQALDSLKDYSEDRILVVSHGGVSRALQALHQRLHHTKMYEIDKIGNAEIYEFEL